MPAAVLRALLPVALLAGLGPARAQPAAPAAVQASAPSGPLKVCMAADNAPLSYTVKGQPRGLDLRIAEAAAAALGRPLAVVPFETEFEKESTLTHEVNALLSSGVCEAVSGFPLLHDDLGPPTRASARTPDYPGARRKRERPYIALGTLAASRAYQGVSLGVVQRSGGAPLNALTGLGERRLAAVSGTLASALAMSWRHGRLRGQLVSLGQREDPLAELARPEGARFDAVLVPLALFDGWRLLHPGAGLEATAYRRAIGVNLGFVTLEGAGAVREALDRTIAAALADGRLARWAADEGVSWVPPAQPEVSRGPSLAELAAD